MAVQSRTQVITASGSAGSAQGTGDFSNLSPSKLVAVYLDYSASTPATCDVYIKCNGITVWHKDNNATDGWFYPRAQAVDSGSTAITGSAVPITLVGDLTVFVDQSNGSETVTATLIVEV